MRSRDSSSAPGGEPKLALLESLVLTPNRWSEFLSRSPLVRIAVGLALAVANYAALAYWADALGEERMTIFAFPAVVLAAWMGRLLGGVVATAACTILIVFFFTEPSGSFALGDAQDARALTFFVGFGILLSFLFEGFELARRRQFALSKQRAQLADELLRVQQRKAMLLDNVPGLVWELGVAPGEWPPHVRYVTANAWRLTGYSAEQWIETDLLWKTILPETSRTRFEEALRRAIDSGSWNVRHEFRRDDGELRIFETHLTAESTGVTGGQELRGVSFDVTDLETAERAVVELERNFREVADRAPIMMWISQPGLGNVWSNRAWLEFRGHSLEEEQGEAWRDSVHPDDVEQLSREVARAYEAKSEFHAEFRIRRSDGEWRWILSIGVPRKGPNGSFQDYLGFCLDISERKQLELDRDELLRQTELARSEAELAIRTKDEFFAKVSHELRNPLNGILGWTQILTSGRPEPEEIERGISLIDASARSLARLVDDLLDVSRILSGKLRLSLVPTSLASVIDAACRAVQPSAAAKGIDLDCEIDDHLPWVEGDPQRLQQVIWNLLSNAVKFTPQGGRVGLHARRRAEHLEVEVRDDGIGIAADFLPHVFSAFRQAEGSATRSHQGLGLGLSIVHHLVEQHGGEVTVESQGPGRGARFVVRLPAIEPEGAAGEAPTKVSPEELPDLRILVLDDDAIAREMLRTLLTRAGATVHEAASAGEALSKLMSDPPDLLLSDLEMPGEDGFTFIRRVRELSDERGGAIPAIALTAYARETDRRKALLAGFQEHHAKPIDAAKLLDSIHHLVHR